MNDESKNRKRGRRTGLVITVLVLASVAAVVVVWEVSSKRYLEAAIQKARDIDSRLTIVEVLNSQERPPDEKNGALALVEIFPDLEKMSEDPEWSRCPIVGGVEPPELGRQWDQETAARVADLLDRHVNVLNAIDRVTQFDGGTFPVDIGPDPIATLLPHLAKLRTSAKLKSLHATQELFAGRKSAFTNDLEVLCALTDLIRDDPYLISALVAIAMDSLTLQTIERGCSGAVFSGQEVGQLEGVLKQLDAPNRLYTSMVGERTIIYSVPKLILDGKGKQLSSEMPRIPNIPVLRGLLRRDMATGINILNGYIQAVQNPDTAYLAAQQTESLAKNLPKYAVISRILVPALSRCFITERRLEAQLRAAHIALAVERFRLDHQSWPEQLDQLVPDYLKKIPADPFKGQPMSFLVDDGTVVVYSIGDDETDNGGDVKHHRVTDKEQTTDWGFVLLPPERRNRPPLPSSMPTTQP